MRFFVSWLQDDGTATKGVEWPDYFEDAMVPSIGDCLVEALGEGEADAARVVERYVYFDSKNDPVWHLIVARVRIPQDRIAAFDLPDVETVDI